MGDLVRQLGKETLLYTDGAEIPMKSMCLKVFERPIMLGLCKKRNGEEDDDFFMQTQEVPELDDPYNFDFDMVIEDRRNLPSLTIREKESALDPPNEGVDEEAIMRKIRNPLLRS